MFNPCSISLWFSLRLNYVINVCGIEVITVFSFLLSIDLDLPWKSIITRQRNVSAKESANALVDPGSPYKACWISTLQSFFSSNSSLANAHSFSVLDIVINAFTISQIMMLNLKCCATNRSRSTNSSSFWLEYLFCPDESTLCLPMTKIALYNWSSFLIS